MGCQDRSNYYSLGNMKSWASILRFLKSVFGARSRPEAMPSDERWDDVITKPTVSQCGCGRTIYLVDGNENPPIAQDELEKQSVCLMSRDGDWFFCDSQGSTWVRAARRAPRT